MDICFAGKYSRWYVSSFRWLVLIIILSNFICFRIKFTSIRKVMFSIPIKRDLITIQQKSSNGRIVGRNMLVSDNGNGQLTLSGDILITLKVLDLTSSGTPNIQRLMKLSEQAIAIKLRGTAYGRSYFFEYNSAKKTFTSRSATYSLRYNFTYSARV